MRIGHGYDVHRLVTGRKLILGGVEISHYFGLMGHSDADVLTHAVIDALLGAACLGDIGSHFPDSDPAYEGSSSVLLLGKVTELIHAAGWRVENVDATLLAQKPKLAPYITRMRRQLARSMGVLPDCISIKATTEEGLGFTGREEGIAAHAVCLLNTLSQDTPTSDC
ncbi:MAG: 2-C-methyl-D-erythritol 2,4-cyclodiphosphate synthase [Clostridia bacterium]|nr:2-C-methyl-D-erythritol 2,4-cyclodiphosphate synthase [Clostridia bacterium]